MVETATRGLSDRSVAVFAFAAYHQLDSGRPVTSIVRSDGKGHKADEGAVSELTHSGLIELDGNDICFTADGLAVLARAIEGLKVAARE